MNFRFIEIISNESLVKELTGIKYPMMNYDSFSIKYPYKPDDIKTVHRFINNNRRQNPQAEGE